MQPRAARKAPERARSSARRVARRPQAAGAGQATCSRGRLPSRGWCAPSALLRHTAARRHHAAAGCSCSSSTRALLNPAMTAISLKPSRLKPLPQHHPAPAAAARVLCCVLSARSRGNTVLDCPAVDKHCSPSRNVARMAASAPSASAAALAPLVPCSSGGEACGAADQED